MGEIPGSQNEKWQEPIPTGKHTSGFWGFWAGSYLGKTPGSQNEKWQEPHSTYKHTQGPGAFGRDLLGEISGSRNEKWQGPIYTKRGEKKKKKKGRELEKTLASSKILTHGLGSLKGSPQSEKEKERALRSDDPAVWSWSPASYQ